MFAAGKAPGFNFGPFSVLVGCCWSVREEGAESGRIPAKRERKGVDRRRFMMMMMMMMLSI
jgi:hypothetical protein